MLKKGDDAPKDIVSKNQKNLDISLKDYLGEKILLYFYPKDDTPGCTTEACNFRDEQEVFSKFGVKIVGVSTDSVESHIKFKNKYNLNFDLWSDPEHKLADAFGVWSKKKLFGKVGMGVKRTTFLIDENGEIEQVWPDVSVDQHSTEILEYLQN